MMADFVVDNSVVMSWCFQDEGGEYADKILSRLESAQAFVPSVWPLEVGNVLVVAERQNRLSEADTILFLSLLGQLPILVEQETPGRMLREIVALAREHDLSTYDASYLDLAMRSGIPIATLDATLIRAAQRSRVGVV